MVNLDVYEQEKIHEHALSVIKDPETTKLMKKLLLDWLKNLKDPQLKVKVLDVINGYYNKVSLLREYDYQLSEVSEGVTEILDALDTVITMIFVKNCDRKTDGHYTQLISQLEELKHKIETQAKAGLLRYRRMKEPKYKYSDEYYESYPIPKSRMYTKRYGNLEPSNEASMLCSEVMKRNLEGKNLTSASNIFKRPEDYTEAIFSLQAYAERLEEQRKKEELSNQALENEESENNALDKLIQHMKQAKENR